jgi:Predicted membrane protein (DUF2232)
MTQWLLVAVGAGAASALLHASFASGSAIALILLQLAPLPILIAAIGWGPLTAVVAAFLAATALGLGLRAHFFVTYLLAIGLPSWWLGYLALLARPINANGSGAVEWYPVGRLVFWAAIIGTLIVAATVLVMGPDLAAFQSRLRTEVETFLKAGIKSTPDVLNRPDVKQMIDAMVMAFAPAAAVMFTIIYTFNLWLAARIVDVSGRLRRPWPDLPTFALPPFTPGLLAAAIAGSFLPDIAGLLAGVLAASLFMTYAFMGFAVLHAITRGVGGRSFILGGAYVALVILGIVWPLLAVSLLGVAENLFSIRARFATPAAGPPTTRT